MWIRPVTCDISGGVLLLGRIVHAWSSDGLRFKSSETLRNPKLAIIQKDIDGDRFVIDSLWMVYGHRSPEIVRGWKSWMFVVLVKSSSHSSKRFLRSLPGRQEMAAIWQEYGHVCQVKMRPNWPANHMMVHCMIWWVCEKGMAWYGQTMWLCDWFRISYAFLRHFFPRVLLKNDERPPGDDGDDLTVKVRKAVDIAALSAWQDMTRRARLMQGEDKKDREEIRKERKDTNLRRKSVKGIEDCQFGSCWRSGNGWWQWNPTG